jgi:hypothetical protein
MKPLDFTIDTITTDHHAADNQAAELRRTGHKVRVIDRMVRAMRDERRVFVVLVKSPAAVVRDVLDERFEGSGPVA